MGLSPIMVGRTGPLGRLLALFGDPRRDERPAVALVSGEGGVGKTRLLQELIGAVPAGTVVLSGAAEPGSLGRPYELVTGLLPEAAARAASGDAPADVAAAVADRIGGSPAVVVFEDLHWADSESVAVFERLAASALPATLLVGTARTEELTRRLPAGEMLERLERRQFVSHVRLERLSRLEVGTFLASVYGKVPPSGTVAALHQRTGGNPFFLEELLNVAGEVDPAELEHQPLPWSLAELVSAQLDGLSAEERCVVEAAAVLGRRADFDLVVAVTGMSEPELIGHLRGLVRRGLLVEECDDEFSFRHALGRDAVEGQLLGRERRRLHESALTALRATCPTDYAGLARHAGGAGRYEEVVALGRVGVEHYLRRGSTYQALQLATDALGEAPDDAELLGGAARAAWLVGLYDEALVHAERWRRVARTPAERAAAIQAAARQYHELEREADLWRAFEELRALAAELEPGEERALVLAHLAQLLMLRQRSEEAVEWAERAIAAADAVGAAGVRAQALVERASAMASIPDRAAEGHGALEAAIAAAEAVEDWVLVARGLNNLQMWVPVEAPDGRELTERLRAAAERAGFDTMGQANHRLRQAEFEVAQGNQAEARRLVREVSDLAPSGVTEGKLRWCKALEALLALEAGEPGEARRILATAQRIPPDDRPWFGLLQLALAGRRGDRPGAEAAVAALHAVLDEHHAHPGNAEDVFVIVEAVHAVGLPTAAARDLVARWPVSAAFGDAWRPLLEGAVAAAEDRPDDVVALLGGPDGLAAASPDEAGGRAVLLSAVRQAALHGSLARSLAASGRRGPALAAARRGRELLERWPGWRRDELDALIRRLEGPAGAGASTGERGDGEVELTAREREVAALLAEGVTNAELARRLFISPKTAAVHVSNILMKLGMSTRAEVAAWAVRSGLADGPADRPA
jgi:DNA-binding CsgD family transcriptional regulator/tetratricopeptide (TPR) repeat protein